MILYQLLILVLTSLLYIHAREILSPPRIVKQPPTDEISFHVATDRDENDEPFYIDCEATGEPSPKYHWIKNGKKFDWQTYDDRISQQIGRGTLIFSKPTNDDIGQYQCFAENEWGVATSNSVFIRRAQLNSFKNSPPLILSGKEGEPYKLSCQQPDGWPKLNVDWIIQNEGGGFNSINNSRITLDPEGNLWFSYLTLNDASKGFMYACTASSATRFEYKLGNRVVFNVLESDGANKHPAVPQYVTRKNKVALRGKSVELFCIFGGKPLPQTVWLKNGKRIDFGDRISQRNYGKSLLIKLVNFDDQGAYTCEVSNGVGEAKLYSINLEVLAVPYFTEEPEFIIAAEDETVELRCAAAGVPEPEIQWIYNGKPIAHAPPNSRRKVGPSNIVIERLTEKDIGNYGCNATNSLGYVYKDVYINVLAFPPEITEAPTNLEAVDGKDINIPCKVYGVPKPAVKWIRNGKALTGDKYKVLNSGDLHIPNVQFGDGGEYICYAENKFGNVNASCSFIVRENTEVTVGAEYIEVAAGTQATFRCKVKHDNNLDLNDIIWLFNGYPIELNEEPRFVLTPDYSLSISKTNELDSGTYTCRAQTSLDEAEASGWLIVQDVPNAPEITQIECNKMDATVKWLPMGDNRAPIHRYSIQYSTSFTPNTWEDMSNNIPPPDMSYNVHMSPWANYTFRVIATNKIGPSEPSRHSSICSTNPEVPQKNPDNVEGKGDRPDNLVISWTPMPQIEHNAPGFHYKVYWKQDIPGEPYFTREILDWQQSQIVVENVPSFTQYRIKVVAINYLGEANVLAREVIGYSGEDHVPNPPEITQIECNKMDATVKWLPMGDNRAPIHRYSIQYSTSFTPNTWEDMSNNIPPTDMSYNVHMSPWANYTFRVIATNKIGPSEPSRHSSICSTNAEVPQKNPDNVEGKGDRPDNLVISWTPMPQIEHNAPGFHYKVYWKQDIPGEPYFTREILDWQQSQIVVENVPSFTQYRIKVVAINYLGEANVLAREVIGYSGEDHVPNPPEITQIECNKMDATVKWLPMGDNRAPIHRYSIQYSTSFTPNTWEDMSNNIPPTDMSYNVHMTPWANYTFRVIATNKIGPSEPSRHSSICSTNPEVPHKNPDNVEGKGDRPDNLVISWTPMPQIEHNAPGFHYKVYWKQDIPGEPYFTREIKDWQQSQIVVENVPSFTQYRIKVVAINYLGEANVLAREVIGYSGEDQPLLAPENFTLIQILSPTAALLNWNPVPAHSVRGHFKGYKIKTWTENEVGYRELQVRADATAALVNNLVPYSKNFVQIYVYNDKYNGPPSNALTIDMPEGAPGPISSLDAYQLGASAFYLDWKKPERSNGVLTGYRIYYSVINGPNVGEMFEREQNVTDPDQLQAKVAGLQPNTKYRLYVVAATSVGVSPKYMIERTTKAVEPAVRPSIPNFSMQRIPTTNGSATIRVIWKPVINGNPGSYFFVKYKKKGESDYLETKPEFEFEYFDVTALEPEQTYEFILVACNGDTYKTPSEAQEINL